MTIHEIEKMTYAEAEIKAIEKTLIKGHTVFFVDFNDTFGYSALVFKNNRHIHYANEYQLHHGYFVEEHGKEHLRGYFTELLKHKLFFDGELDEPIKSYDEYKRKLYFIVNYYLMRYDHRSIYKTYEDDIDKNEYPGYSTISSCHLKSQNIAKEQLRYYDYIKQSYEKLKTNDESFREMIIYEMANHETRVTADYTDALAALGMTITDLSPSQFAILTEEFDKLLNGE